MSNEAKNDFSPTRRRLLNHTATGVALAALPDWFLFGSAQAAREREAARPRRFQKNDTLQIGVIGLGGNTPGSFHQGLNDARAVAGRKGTKIVALCDVDADHLTQAGAIWPDAKRFSDFRELIARGDIDAVIIGAPDHWHSVMSVRAMNENKDVYCEKPMTLTISEGREMVKVARRKGRVFQNGSQQRSDKRFRLACELVRNGRIGKVARVEAHVPTARAGGPFEEKAPPGNFNWEMWLGPAPLTPYIPQRTHGSFRYWYEYSGGMVTDWGAHHLDIAQWGLGRDESGPIRIESIGISAPPDPTKHSFNVHTSFNIIYTYDDGATVLLTTRGENGVKFIGENGAWIFVNRSRIGASDSKLIEEPLGENRATKLYVSDNHAQDWVDCVRAGRKPICDVEVGHRSATVCHLGNISLRMGSRTLAWNPRREEFDDKAANLWRSRPMRAPWTF